MRLRQEYSTFFLQSPLVKAPRESFHQKLNLLIFPLLQYPAAIRVICEICGYSLPPVLVVAGVICG